MKRLSILLLLAVGAFAQNMTGPKLTVQEPQWTGAFSMGEPILVCPTDTNKAHWWRVKDCPALDGPQVTKLVNYFGERMDEVSHCNGWGPWIIDGDGTVIGQFRNPPCTRKIKGPRSEEK